MALTLAKALVTLALVQCINVIPWKKHICQNKTGFLVHDIDSKKPNLIMGLNTCDATHYDCNLQSQSESSVYVDTLT